MRIRFDAVCLGAFKIAAFGRFLINRLEIGLLDGGKIGFKVDKCLLRLANEARFACEVGIELFCTCFEFARPVGSTLGLAIQIFLLDFEPRQSGGLHGFGFAKWRQALGKAQFFVEGIGFGLGRRAETRHGIRQVRLVVLDTLLRVLPCEMHGKRFLLTDFAGNFLVAARLPRLPLQSLRLRLQLADDIAEALDVGLGRPETQFRFVAARVQAGDAGRVFENTAALLRLGVDQFADLPLPHERRRARAGRRVLEQNLDVARPHFPAVDAIGGARFALDAPRDFDNVVVVEFGGRPARRCCRGTS